MTDQIACPESHFVQTFRTFCERSLIYPASQQTDSIFDFAQRYLYIDSQPDTFEQFIFKNSHLLQSSLTEYLNRTKNKNEIESIFQQYFEQEKLPIDLTKFEYPSKSSLSQQNSNQALQIKNNPNKKSISQNSKTTVSDSKPEVLNENSNQQRSPAISMKIKSNSENTISINKISSQSTNKIFVIQTQAPEPQQRIIDTSIHKNNKRKSDTSHVEENEGDIINFLGQCALQKLNSNIPEDEEAILLQSELIKQESDCSQVVDEIYFKKEGIVDEIIRRKGGSLTPTSQLKYQRDSLKSSFISSMASPTHLNPRHLTAVVKTQINLKEIKKEKSFDHFLENKNGYSPIMMKELQQFMTKDHNSSKTFSQQSTESLPKEIQLNANLQNNDIINSGDPKFNPQAISENVSQQKNQLNFKNKKPLEMNLSTIKEESQQFTINQTAIPTEQQYEETHHEMAMSQNNNQYNASKRIKVENRQIPPITAESTIIQINSTKSVSPNSQASSNQLNARKIITTQSENSQTIKSEQNKVINLNSRLQPIKTKNTQEALTQNENASKSSNVKSSTQQIFSKPQIFVNNQEFKIIPSTITAQTQPEKQYQNDHDEHTEISEQQLVPQTQFKSPIGLSKQPSQANQTSLRAKADSITTNSPLMTQNKNPIQQNSVFERVIRPSKAISKLELTATDKEIHLNPDSFNSNNKQKMHISSDIYLNPQNDLNIKNKSNVCNVNQRRSVPVNLRDFQQKEIQLFTSNDLQSLFTLSHQTNQGIITVLQENFQEIDTKMKMQPASPTNNFKSNEAINLESQFYFENFQKEKSKLFESDSESEKQPQPFDFKKINVNPQSKSNLKTQSSPRKQNKKISFVHIDKANNEIYNISSENENTIKTESKASSTSKPKTNNSLQQQQHNSNKKPNTLQLKSKTPVKNENTIQDKNQNLNSIKNTQKEAIIQKEGYQNQGNSDIQSLRKAGTDQSKAQTINKQRFDTSTNVQNRKNNNPKIKSVQVMKENLSSVQNVSPHTNLSIFNDDLNDSISNIKQNQKIAIKSEKTLNNTGRFGKEVALNVQIQNFKDEQDQKNNSIDDKNPISNEITIDEQYQQGESKKEVFFKRKPTSFTPSAKEIRKSLNKLNDSQDPHEYKVPSKSQFSQQNIFQSPDEEEFIEQDQDIQKEDDENNFNIISYSDTVIQQQSPQQINQEEEEQKSIDGVKSKFKVQFQRKVTNFALGGSKIKIQSGNNQEDQTLQVGAPISMSQFSNRSLQDVFDEEEFLEEEEIIEYPQRKLTTFVKVSNDIKYSINEMGDQDNQLKVEPMSKSKFSSQQLQIQSDEENEEEGGDFESRMDRNNERKVTSFVDSSKQFETAQKTKMHQSPFKSKFQTSYSKIQSENEQKIEKGNSQFSKNAHEASPSKEIKPRIMSANFNSSKFVQSKPSIHSKQQNHSILKNDSPAPSKLQKTQMSTSPLNQPSNDSIISNGSQFKIKPISASVKLNNPLATQIQLKNISHSQASKQAPHQQKIEIKQQIQDQSPQIKESNSTIADQLHHLKASQAYFQESKPKFEQSSVSHKIRNNQQSNQIQNNDNKGETVQAQKIDHLPIINNFPGKSNTFDNSRNLDHSQAKINFNAQSQSSFYIMSKRPNNATNDVSNAQKQNQLFQSSKLQSDRQSSKKSKNRKAQLPPIHREFSPPSASLASTLYNQSPENDLKKTIKKHPQKAELQMPSKAIRNLNTNLIFAVLTKRKQTERMRKWNLINQKR